jgi:kumamolisin
LATVAIATGLVVGMAVSAAGAAPNVSRPSVARPLVISDTIPKVVRSGMATRVGAYAPKQMLRVVIGLRLPYLAEEKAFLGQLQDRTSPLFHHYLTAAQWNARFAPSQASQQSVISWVRSQSLKVTKTFADRLLVDTAGTVAAYQHAFGVRIDTYRLGARSFFANANSIVVPASISSEVESVNGLDSYRQMTPSSTIGGHAVRTPTAPVYAAGSVVAKGLSIHRNGSLPRGGLRTLARIRPHLLDGLISPPDLWSQNGYDEGALYATGKCCNVFDNPTTQSPVTSTIAISTSGGFDNNDLAAFAANSSSWAGGTTLAYNVGGWLIDGTAPCCNLETTLDVESATAMANSFGSYTTTAKVVVYEGVNANLGTFEDVDNTVLSKNETRVFTTSWGLDEGTTGTSTMTTFNGIFNAMSGMGWTMNAAAGDSGSYDNGSSLSVDYPASDPNMIAAGGTELHLNSDGTYNHETAWNSGGGGCSTYWSAPGYQSAASVTTGCGSKRAVPDISLNASNNTRQVLYFDGGTLGNPSALYSVWGTSEVAPELAGLWAVENSYLQSEGSICGGAGTAQCGPMGDNHGSLYREAEATLGGLAAHYPFYDITTGNNDNGTGTGSYPAGTGYDLATGWGSDNMFELARAINWEAIFDYYGPEIGFTAPAPGWYRTDQSLSWNVTDPIQGADVAAAGVEGYTYGWGSVPPDSFILGTPGGASDSYYTGPASPGSTAGSVELASQGQGCHTLYVDGWTNLGYATTSSPGQYCYDTIPPTITQLPKLAIASHAQLTSSGAAINLSWAATDSGSGVASYGLQEKVNGGAYVAVTLSHPNLSYATLRLQPGKTYRFRVHATDVAGNTSAYSYGTSFKLSLYQENSSSVLYTGHWIHSGLTGASGGFVDDTTAKNATATFKFTGSQVAWVSTVAGSRGSASAKIVGSSTSTTVSTHSGTTVPAYVVYTTSLSAGSHKLLLTNKATSGHPRIDVDAFLVIT